MKTFTKSLAATALAVSGLLTVVAMPASAASSTKKTTCYELTSTALVTKTVTTKSCPAGYSATKPSLQGTGLKGDTDLVTPGSAQLNINGSSFDAPLIGVTTSGQTSYNALNSNVSFSSYPAGGSGSGRTGITNGSLDIGFSDQPMTSTAGTLPSGVTASNYVQVPFLLGGAVVAYNIPGLDNVKLTAADVAAIYDGKITTWSDSRLVTDNGGSSSKIGSALAALANSSYNTIKVLYRSASSGTTYAFTDWLNAAGASGHTPSGNVMEGTGGWGASNVKGEANNAAMASDLNSIQGSIGYVEYSYVLIPGNAKIQVASLQDYNGQWLTPSLTNIANAASAAGSNITPDNFSIVDQRGNNVWPLATYSWAIVAKAASSAAKGEAEVKFLDWETHAGQAQATGQGYVPLPAAAAAYARQQLAGVTYNGAVCLNQAS
jgi:phosphate transport system substrate-binding protein